MNLDIRHLGCDVQCPANRGRNIHNRRWNGEDGIGHVDIGISLGTGVCESDAGSVGVGLLWDRQHEKRNFHHYRSGVLN